MKTILRQGGLLLLALLTGCAINAANQSIRQDFQGRYECPQVRINKLAESTQNGILGPEVESLRMMAQGCGVNAIYTCDDLGVCVQEKADERGYEKRAGQASLQVRRVPMPTGQVLMLAALSDAWIAADVSVQPPRVTFFQSTTHLNASQACNLSLLADGRPVALAIPPGAALSDFEGCAVELDLRVLGQLAAASRVTGSVRGVALELTPVEHATLRELTRRVNETVKAGQTLAQGR